MACLQEFDSLLMPTVTLPYRLLVFGDPSEAFKLILWAPPTLPRICASSRVDVYFVECCLHSIYQVAAEQSQALMGVSRELVASQIESQIFNLLFNDAYFSKEVHSGVDCKSDNTCFERVL